MEDVRKEFIQLIENADPDLLREIAAAMRKLWQDQQATSEAPEEMCQNI